MTDAKTTVVTFQSDLFNKKEARDYFINPDCYGDDVCVFIIQKLRAANVECDENPKQEDWGWCFRFRLNGVKYLFNCSLRREWPAPQGVEDEPWDQAWIGFLEHQESGLLSNFGIGKKKIPIEAVQQIQKVLKDSNEISDILWHEAKNFDRGNENLGEHNPK